MCEYYKGLLKGLFKDKWVILKFADDDGPIIGYCHGIKKQLDQRHYVITPDDTQIRDPLLVHMTNDLWIREYYPAPRRNKKIDNVIYIDFRR